MRAVNLIKQMLRTKRICYRLPEIVLDFLLATTPQEGYQLRHIKKGHALMPHSIKKTDKWWRLHLVNM